MHPLQSPKMKARKLQDCYFAAHITRKTLFELNGKEDLNALNYSEQSFWDDLVIFKLTTNPIEFIHCIKTIEFFLSR